MKKIIALGSFLAVMFMLPSMASAATDSGTLLVTATVDASISMVFDSDASGVALSAEGAHAATLAFGNVSAYDSLASPVSRSVNGTTDYTISTPFDVKVTKANSSSADFTLTAALNAADADNVWKVGGVTVDDAGEIVNDSGAYGSDVSYSLALTIPFSSADLTSISNTINFIATAN